MPVSSISIKGFRGFAEQQTLELAQPQAGKPGSGLTILVGPNNGGKSTVLDALRAFFERGNPVFSEGKRNANADARISIRLTIGDDQVHELHTIGQGGSETERQPTNQPPINFYGLPSRRFFSPYFGSKGQGDREVYPGARGLPAQRTQATNDFSHRLFEAAKSDRFHKLFARVVDTGLDWIIEQADLGQYYVKVNVDDHHHNSDGLGDGLVSLLFLVDALYDSMPGALISIDEPEVSLHPAYQRRFLSLLAEYAMERQILVATHSPYFIDFDHIRNGARVARVHRTGDGSLISHLSVDAAGTLCKLIDDWHNPHLLGVDAREVLFMDDGIVVLEGQEDVVLYPEVLRQLAEDERITVECREDLKERFFGWGAGGAGNVRAIVTMLRDLGFRRVAAIFDSDKADDVSRLSREFPEYRFDCIPADDVRFKDHPNGSAYGLLDEKRVLRECYVDDTARLLECVHRYVIGRNGDESELD